ncbi:hypothetical protein J8Z82_10430 [Yersinia enterocolitica]|uniref:hypothetical protein n=1 Tax=Yersinia enterocolitica TaxID=630 RepID=UPI001C8EC876|nr:hypothetical protein [Yersinia enterocolitica]MBX9485956.1 hypothetical protein [Yersinia enterocolitica]MBX9492203.1 hypothetical protein [Yersinia enterocolitica]
MNSPVSPRFIRNKVMAIACTSSLTDLPDSDLTAEVIAANCSGFRFIFRPPTKPFHMSPPEAGHHLAVGTSGAGKPIHPEFILRSLSNHNKGPN